jgi:predicted  nucleic acid-binding Zn-ribbon protein
MAKQDDKDIEKPPMHLNDMVGGLRKVADFIRPLKDIGELAEALTTAENMAQSAERRQKAAEKRTADLDRQIDDAQVRMVKEEQEAQAGLKQALATLKEMITSAQTELAGIRGKYDAANRAAAADLEKIQNQVAAARASAQAEISEITKHVEALKQEEKSLKERLARVLA